MKEWGIGADTSTQDREGKGGEEKVWSRVGGKNST